MSVVAAIDMGVYRGGTGMAEALWEGTAIWMDVMDYST
jgi:hypothetical protein